MEGNTNYLTNNFLTYLFKEVQPKKNLLNCTDREMQKIRKERIEQLSQILKIEQLKNLLNTDITYEVEEKFESMGIQIYKYKVDAIKNLSFPIYHIQPKQSKGKTILYLHGHDDLGIMGALLERYDKVRYHKMIPLLLAKEGYDVIAPEEIGFGDARFFDFPAGTEKLNGCIINSDYLTLSGFSIAGFRAYQSVRTLDFMEQIVSMDNVTSFGISGGGMTCQQTGVLDDRIHQIIIACYANTYQKSILAKEHCLENYVPGLLSVGDSYQLLSLAAPKPLLTVNGTGDKGFPKEGSKTAFDYLEKVYERMDASQNYQGILFEGKHEIKEEIILDWLRKFV